MRVDTTLLGPHNDGRHHQSWVSPTTQVTLHYESRSPKYDCDTLIVIFSSIRGNNSWLDFDGLGGRALATNRARLLFVFDDFSAEYTYYVMKAGTETVRVAVEVFLLEYIDAHGYSSDRVIFCGLSKGASAALLLGSRFSGAPIVALGPQISIGSYLSGRNDLIFESMIGPRVQKNIDQLDQLVPDALINDVDHRRPLYILTSTTDLNCYRKVTGSTSILSPYANASLVTTSSKRAIEHATTLHYLMPSLLSLLGLLSNGLYPKIAGPAVDAPINRRKLST